jgi:hypothetical protein
MTTTQQTKIAELLVGKFAAEHNQPPDQTLAPSIRHNQIQRYMPLAKVVYGLMRDAYQAGAEHLFSDEPLYFDNFLNNITK